MKTDALIEEQIRQLRNEEQRHSAIVAEHAAEQKSLRMAISRLEAVLAQVRDDKPLKSSSEGDRHPRISESRLKPADAVKRLLASHAEGLTRAQIIAELDGTLNTASGDPRRLLYNTIFNLKKRGTVKESDGKIVLAHTSG